MRDRKCQFEVERTRKEIQASADRLVQMARDAEQQGKKEEATRLRNEADRLRRADPTRL